MLDGEMHYLAVSNCRAAGHGLKSPQHLVGRSHYEEHPDLSQDIRREHKEVLAGATLRRPRAFLKDRKGRPIRQTCIMCPWYTMDRKVGGMIIMLGSVDMANSLLEEKSGAPLPTRQEFMQLLATL